MNITFLGGGDEIGASSAIVEIGSARILIDCGIRMSGEHRLPDLAAIKDAHAGQLDAVLLTHAHMDHSGALPVLHQHFPGVAVYANAPTRGLVEVLTLQAMDDATSHRLRIRPHVNTFDLVEIARKLVPANWRLMKQPSVHSDMHMVAVKFWVMPSPEELAEACEQYDEMTGFRLSVSA
jgi:predicted metal-dependent RNase